MELDNEHNLVGINPKEKEKLKKKRDDQEGRNRPKNRKKKRDSEDNDPNESPFKKQRVEVTTTTSTLNTSLCSSCKKDGGELTCDICHQQNHLSCQGIVSIGGNKEPPVHARCLKCDGDKSICSACGKDGSADNMSCDLCKRQNHLRCKGIIIIGANGQPAHTRCKWCNENKLICCGCGKDSTNNQHLCDLCGRNNHEICDGIVPIGEEGHGRPARCKWCDLNRESPQEWNFDNDTDNDSITTNNDTNSSNSMTTNDNRISKKKTLSPVEQFVYSFHCNACDRDFNSKITKNKHENTRNHKDKVIAELINNPAFKTWNTIAVQSKLPTTPSQKSKSKSKSRTITTTSTESVQPARFSQIRDIKKIFDELNEAHEDLQADFLNIDKHATEDKWEIIQKVIQYDEPEPKSYEEKLNESKRVVKEFSFDDLDIIKIFLIEIKNQ